MLRPGWGRSTEGRFVWGVIGLALVASTLPYLYGWWRTPAGWVFQWIPPHNSADSNTYLAWVQQGARGRLLFEDLYTTETGRMPVFLPLFLAMGLVSRATGLAPMTVYHLFRLVEGVHLPICLLAAHGVALLESRFEGGSAAFHWHGPCRAHCGPSCGGVRCIARRRRLIECRNR